MISYIYRQAFINRHRICEKNAFEAYRNRLTFHESIECGVSVHVLINCNSNRTPAAFYRVWIGLAGKCSAIREFIRLANETLTDRGFETVANLFQKINLYANFISGWIPSKNLIRLTGLAKNHRLREKIYIFDRIINTFSFFFVLNTSRMFKKKN